jgi:predicted RNA-binding protein with PUA-like domain
MGGRRYWLLKSEPSTFSVADLAKAPGRTTSWDGVRNYHARNFLRAMQVGDEALFYHSNADPPAVVGIVEIVREAYPDETAFDRRDPHYDPKSKPASPIWDVVDVRLVRIFPRPLPLDELRAQTALRGMELLRRGSRLSVQPVRPAEWKAIVKLAEAGPRAR